MKRIFLYLLTGMLFAVAVTAMETTELSANPGEKVTTGGWADNGKMAYSKAEIKVIDDTTFPNPAQKFAAFKKAIASDSEKFIVLSGDVDLSGGKVSDKDHSFFDQFNSDGTRKNADFSISIGSNTTLIGTNNARIKYGGISIKSKKNIIIRNVTFYDDHGSTEINTKVKSSSKASADSLGIEGSTSNVWVDHCTFTDGICVDLQRNYNHDGSFDIKSGKNITVSYCEFTNHDKVMLIAPSDSFTTPEDRQITLHHNYFHDVIQRLPRSRGTQMHIYNNVYDNIGIKENSGSSLGPGIASQYIVENNFFGKHAGPIIKYYDSSDKKAKTFSKFYHSGNIPKLSSSICSYDKIDKLKSFSAHESAEKPWSIPYSYTLEDAEQIKKSVPVSAGAGKPMAISGL